MELKITKKTHDNNKTYTTIIENLTILYCISAVMIFFFETNNYKIILDMNNFYDKSNLYSFFDDKNHDELFLFIFNIILVFLFFKVGYNIINITEINRNYKNNIFYYTILSLVQFVKPVLILYIYYNNYNQKLNVSIMFNIIGIILNIISIKLIIRYKNLFLTLENNK